MDGLPVLEKTGLPYASCKRMNDANGVEHPVMHACGHDIHMTCLLAGATIPAYLTKLPAQATSNSNQIPRQDA
jgi:metal-dependent amidase/aminoacylase/carboxypeptidase family protein